MSQERLNVLATICIEKDLLDKVNVDTIINDFASKYVRRKGFTKLLQLVYFARFIRTASWKLRDRGLERRAGECELMECELEWRSRPCDAIFGQM